MNFQIWKELRFSDNCDMTWEGITVIIIFKMKAITDDMGL
jgi:hypothetical protein